MDPIIELLARKRERQAALTALVAGAPEPAADVESTRMTPSFDGGARETPPLLAPSHEETLVAIIGASRADRDSGGFGP